MSLKDELWVIQSIYDDRRTCEVRYLHVTYREKGELKINTHKVLWRAADLRARVGVIPAPCNFSDDQSNGFGRAPTSMGAELVSGMAWYAV